MGDILDREAKARGEEARTHLQFVLLTAQSWDGSSELRERLLTAVRNISAPIFLSHAASDYSVAPGQVMAAELTRLGRSHELKIYPAVGNTPAAGHEAVYTEIATWEGDVFRFLDEHMRR